MQQIQKRLGARIRDLRHKQGLSQEELAHVSGLHRSYVGAVERGEINITLANLYTIARTLKVTISSLLRGVD